MKVRYFRQQIRYSTIALLLVTGLGPARALAQDHSHGAPATRDWSQDQKLKQSALVNVVREATERFRDVRDAEDENYHLVFGCVSGGDTGAMGLHFVNQSLLDDELDPTRPEIILYEPLPNGRVRLTGVDFLVDKAAWDAKHPEGPPQLMGQLFHLFDAMAAVLR
jgi:hypothetical protein